MTLWLYLHFPALQLDSLYATHEQHALVIVDGHKNTIVQHNQTAHKHGIKNGMGLGTAASLCHDLQVHPYKIAIEKEKLAETAHWLYSVTADISLFEPNGILLKVSNMLSLYKNLEHYWQTLHSHLSLLALKYNFATGYSPLAARLLAKVGVNQIISNQENLVEHLHQQSLCHTELSVATIEKLRRVGITTISALLNITLTDLAKRFDLELVNYVGRLTGQLKHPLNFYRPSEAFKHRLELLFEIDNLQWLAKPLSILLTKLEYFLKKRNLITHEITLLLHQRDHGDLELTIHSAQGEYQSQKWLTLSQLTVESIKLLAPVQSITLLVKHSMPLNPLVEDLFSTAKGVYSPEELVSVLQAKLGKQAVQGMHLTEDPRPERSTEICLPLSHTSYCQHQAYKLRPSLLLPRPQRLTEQVAIMQGPERLATGWWDGNPMARDYFIAQTPNGRWLWIYRTAEKQWFLHGIFS
ncbi:DNA polymerase Y family protein [Colwelliaceae bacterium 6471]